MAVGDPYFYDVQLLLHGDGAPLVDSSYYKRNVEPYASVTIPATSASKSGFGTAYFTQGYPNDGFKKSSSAYTLGTSNFTFECFVNPINGGHYYTGDTIIFQLGSNTTAGMLRLVSIGYPNPSNVILQGYSGGSYVNLTTTSSTFASGTWHHLAVTRNGNDWTIWINGVSAATGTNAYSVTLTDLYVLCDSAGTRAYSGYFDDFRFTVGTARYTGSFTPDTVPFPNKPETWQFTFTEGVAVGNEGLGYGDQIDGTTTDAIDIDPVLGFVWGIQWRDGASVVDSMNVRMPVILTDIPSVSDSVQMIKVHKPVATDSVTGADVPAALYRPGAIVVDPVRLAEAMSAVGKYKLDLTDSNVLREVLSVGRLAALSDGVTVADLQVVQRAVSVTERLGIQSVWAAVAKFGLTEIDRVQIADVLRRFFGGEAVESIAIAPALSRSTRLTPQATDSVRVQPVLGNSMVLRLVSTDSFELNDAQVLKLLFNPSLIDEFELTAAFVNPSGGITTWAINAINGAVTQYDNYEFNSFAKFGQTYIAANENGLYELAGGADENDAIISVIRSGLAQLTASRFTMIRDAYLGLRGDGSFILRIATGDGESYDYAFDAQNMKTTRVQLGKGMRARYVSFELISDGSDFDLESVEFIPLMSARRV
jgi:hypothetical protein